MKFDTDTDKWAFAKFLIKQGNYTDPLVIEYVLNCKNNFEFFSTHAVVIKNKQGENVPFVWNTAQHKINEVLETRYATDFLSRLILLKCRQMGASTYFRARTIWRLLFHTEVFGWLLTHEAKLTQNILNGVKTAFIETGISEVLGIVVNTNNREEFRLSNNNVLLAATGSSPDVGRSTTPNIIWGSEAAFWQFFEDIYAGLVQGMPLSPGTDAWLETTAKGRNAFAKLWYRSVAGETVYDTLFIPWTEMVEYRSKVPRPKVFRKSMTPDERAMFDEGVDVEQLKWRRDKIGELGEDKFRQEYPRTPDEAFLLSGSNRFNELFMHNCEQGITQPTWQGKIDGIYLERDDFGPLKRWGEVEKGMGYLIAVDPASGETSNDYTVMIVRDGNGKKCAAYRQKIAPYEAAIVIEDLSKMYNNAITGIEMSQHGGMIVGNLQKGGFHQLYQEDNKSMPGIMTNGPTKVTMVDQLEESICDGSYNPYDIEFYKEAKTYIVTASGKMTAERGSHDDYIAGEFLAEYLFRKVGNRLKLGKDKRAKRRAGRRQTRNIYKTRDDKLYK